MSEESETVGPCLFCRVVAGEVPAEIVRETDLTIAFRDITPQAPTHVLVIPRAHHPNVASMAAADPLLVASLVSDSVEVAEQERLSDYRLVVNTGPEAGQTVFHAHLHVLGGRPMGWPPG